MRACIYARYSTDNQNAETIETQVEKCAEYAQNHGIDVVDIYADEAVSGMKAHRPDLDRLFMDAGLRRFDVVLIYDQSRFSRDIVDWFSFRRAMQNYGISIISVTQSFVGGDLNDPAVFANEGIMALFNQMHVLQTRQKVVDSMERMAKQAIHTGGKPLLGYDVDPDTHKYVINDREADIVRLIFGMYAEGESYNAIIDNLNRRGYKTKRGQSFGKNSLSELLRNERYIGIYVYNKIPRRSGKRNSHAVSERVIRIPDAIPRIVSDDLWSRAQKRLSNNKRNAKNTAKVEYLLSGKLYCGKCGMAMSGGCSNRRYYYYNCTGRQRLRNCDKRPISKDKIEDLVCRYVKQVLGGDENRKRVAHQLFDQQKEIRGSLPTAVRHLQTRLAEIDKKLRNLNDAIANGIWTASTKTMLEDLEAEKRSVYMRLAEAEKSNVSTTKTEKEIYDILTYILDIDTTTIEAKKTLIRFVSKVYVFDDKVRIILNPLGKKRSPNSKTTDAECKGDVTCTDEAGSAAPLLQVRDLLLLVEGVIPTDL